MKITQKTLLSALELAKKEQSSDHITCLLTAKEMIILKRLGYKVFAALRQFNGSPHIFDIKAKDLQSLTSSVATHVYTKNRFINVIDMNLCGEIEGLPYPLEEDQMPIQFPERTPEAKLQANGIHIW